METRSAEVSAGIRGGNCALLLTPPTPVEKSVIKDNSPDCSPATSSPQMAPPSPHKKVWTTLVTNLDYLPGLLTLNHSLTKVKSRYPLVALVTDTFPPKGIAALSARGIAYRKVEHLLPSVSLDYSQDPRFNVCWTKLASFNVVEFDRIVQLDCDMLVLKNMDELMDLELDSPIGPQSTEGASSSGNRVFASCHACVCNPLKRSHYPINWIPSNCAYTSQHSNPSLAQTQGLPPSSGLGMLNSGLLVIRPSKNIYRQVIETLRNESRTIGYEFPDQSLLSDVYAGRWVSLPYIYNALVPMRTKGVHDQIWRDEEVKNLHYILTPKPWKMTKMSPPHSTSASSGKYDAAVGESHDVCLRWWHDVNEDRWAAEKALGIYDGF